jgi:hypothetical protein
MKRFVVFHDYGAYEGWRITGEADTFEEAVRLREVDLANGGGTVEIFEHVPVVATDGRPVTA